MPKGYFRYTTLKGMLVKIYLSISLETERRPNNIQV